VIAGKVVGPHPGLAVVWLRVAAAMASVRLVFIFYMYRINEKYNSQVKGAAKTEISQTFTNNALHIKESRDHV
jgi:hypothetical protein